MAAPNDSLYLFSVPGGATRYLPAVALVSNYLRHPRRKADPSLAEYLTLMTLNTMAKDPNRANHPDRSTWQIRDITRSRIISSLDTRQRPFRDDPVGHLAYKAANLFQWATPLPEDEEFMIGRRIEDTFVIPHPAGDEDDFDDDDSDDDNDNDTW